MSEENMETMQQSVAFFDQENAEHMAISELQAPQEGMTSVEIALQARVDALEAKLDNVLTANEDLRVMLSEQAGSGAHEKSRYSRIKKIAATVGVTVVAALGVMSGNSEKPSEATAATGTVAENTGDTEAPATAQEASEAISASWDRNELEDNDEKRFLKDGLSSIKDAETDADAREAAGDWLEVIRGDGDVFSYMYTKTTGNKIDQSKLFDGNDKSTEYAQAKYDSLQSRIMNGEIEVDEAPRGAHNTGLSDGKLVQNAHAGISGDRTAIKITPQDGEAYWVMARCAQPVFEGEPGLQQGPTDERIVIERVPGQPEQPGQEVTPPVETPEVETPPVETPEVETPPVETPPPVKPPEVTPPPVKPPEVTPPVETPEVTPPPEEEKPKPDHEPADGPPPEASQEPHTDTATPTEGYVPENAEKVVDEQEQAREDIDNGTKGELDPTPLGVEETDGDASDVGGKGSNTGGSQGGTVSQPAVEAPPNPQHQEGSQTDGTNNGTNNAGDSSEADTGTTDEQTSGAGSDPGGF